MPSPRSLLSGFLPRTWCLLALALGIASPASAQAPGTWAPMADLNQPRAEHTATLLANGTVLVAGGRDAAGQPLASAEIYDPATGAYTLLASPLPAPVWGHTATRLDDGTVLIAGGQRGARYRRAAQLFDPASDTFAALTPMSTPRGRHTATLLRDGRVVVIGGTDGVGPLASLEIYDPTTRTFSLAPSALEGARQDHTATLLPDGRVLVAGGSNASGALESAELYDPTAGTVSPAGPLNVPRTLASAALLLDGTVLVAGGQTTTSEDLDSAEVYDAATNAFAWLSAAMGTARSGHLGVQLLHNGKVLISGGTSGGQLVPSAEVYDPVTGAFQPVDSPGTARRLFGANFFELPYTGILLATGGLDSAETPLASSEAFYYPTLRSDKPDYSPGETVTLMGERWRPNETITINIHESSGDPDTNLTATADVSGSFTNQQFIVQPSDLGVRFLATATGQTSNWTAQATFTDGNVKAMAAPSGTTFTLTKSTFSNTTCSGTPASTTTVTGVNSSSGNTTGGVNAGESIKLEAAATSDQNTAFTNWSSSDPFTVVAPRAICVAGFSGGGTRNYFANYTAGADLSITKTDGVTTVTAGTSTTYTITLTNNGPSTVPPGVVVKDTIPANTTGSTTDSRCTIAAGVLTCTTSAALASSAATSFSLTLAVAADYPGTTLTNTATIDSSPVPDPIPGNNSASDTDTVTKSADLELAKSDGVSSVTAGTSTTYAITLKNNGPSTVPPGVVVKDTIPANTTGSTSDSRCTIAAGVLTCTTSAALASSAATSFSLTLAVAADYPGTTLTNTATIDSSPVPDPIPGNNSASDTDTVTKSADLELAKSDGVSSVTAGTSTTYAITLKNNGPSTVPPGVVVKDTIPANTTGSTADSRCTIAAGVLTCTTSAALASSAATSFSLTLAVAADYPGTTLT